jgi:hypothetical protein
MRNDSEHNDKADVTDAAADRRRPGRVPYTNRFLIALLRGKPLHRVTEDVQEGAANTDVTRKLPSDSDDDLDPAVGIVVSVVLALLLWAIILLAVWLFIRVET